MYELIASLTPVQQAALAGFVASVLMAVIKWLAPGSVDAPDEVTAWNRRLISIGTAIVATLVVQAAAPPLVWDQFLIGVATTWFASQGWFGLGKGALSVR